MNGTTDIATLNRLYIGLAREWSLKGEEGKATYTLGIPTEALSLITKMPLSSIEALAESGLLVFGFRTSLPCLRSFLAETADGSPPSVLLKLQHLASHRPQDARREGHGRHLA
jgi:Flagellar transcriptional activator (FlhD)